MFITNQKVTSLNGRLLSLFGFRLHVNLDVCHHFLKW